LKKLIHAFIFILLISSLKVCAIDSTKTKREIYAMVGCRAIRPVKKFFDDYSKDYNAYNLRPGPGLVPFIGAIWLVSNTFWLSGEAGMAFFHPYDKDTFINNQITNSRSVLNIYSLRTEPIYFIPAGMVSFGIGGSIGMNYDANTLKYDNSSIVSADASFTYGVKLAACIVLKKPSFTRINLVYEYVISPHYKFSEASIWFPFYMFK
jgi:hypothetical protein